MIRAVVFDVGRVLVQWDLRHLFAKLIADSEELDWFLAACCDSEWHFQHDAGRFARAEMVPKRGKAEFPAYAAHLDAYATRFNETIPGPVPGSFEIVEELAARGRAAVCDHQLRCGILGASVRPSRYSTISAISSSQALRSW